jgi:hypothetical protein
MLDERLTTDAPVTPELERGNLICINQVIHPLKLVSLGTQRIAVAGDRLHDPHEFPHFNDIKILCLNGAWAHG